MNSKVNGEHKEKVLQRWEGGDSNSDDYDLESDMVCSPFLRTGGLSCGQHGLLMWTFIIFCWAMFVHFCFEVVLGQFSHPLH
jgi:hypothetical protein